MKELFAVFLGGGLGSVVRFIISMLWRHVSLHPRYAGMVFPWPTFIANILGCLLIGFFYQYSDRWGLSPEARLLLTTGFCGGFTTFSTFSYESATLLRSGLYSTFALYIAASLILGIIAVIIPSVISTHTVI